MKRQLTDCFLRSFRAAPPSVRKAFDKRSHLLLEDLKYPSHHAKKYDESRNLGQARVKRGWRFYFTIEGDTYIIADIIAHPKDLS